MIAWETPQVKERMQCLVAECMSEGPGVLQLRKDCGEAMDEVWDRVEALEAKVEGLDGDMQGVQCYTKKLDTQVEEILREVLGTLNQGQPLQQLLPPPPPNLPCPHTWSSPCSFDNHHLMSKPPIAMQQMRIGLQSG